MGPNDAVEALKKADILKEKVENCKDLLNDGDAWVWQQQLQRIYQQVLLQDLEYALDCKVEQELWNYGFKNYICSLQNMVKDRKNHKRSESQAMLTWCLEAASGFYLTLLQEICTAFDLDLSCRRRDSVYGIGENCNVASNKIIKPNTTSCSYICQHCLVHLGDLARYRNQNRQAESFYRHAVQLSPISGQPYNQLALLDSSRGDRLGTVFHYVRSVTVRHLFPAAATNLKRMFSKCAEDQLNLEGRTKLNVQDYVALFLKLHGLLYLGGNLATCSRFIRLLTDTLTAQVATENFTSRKLVQMLAINLFAFHRARGNFLLSENDKFSDQDSVLHQFTPEQKQSKELILDLMAGSLSALLLPVYTIRDNETLADYFALPAIKLTLNWVQLEPHVLLDQAFTSRLQIWPSLCKLLNGLQSVMCEGDCSNKFSSIPLPEDRELQGFLPLEKALQNLRFHHEELKMDSVEINRLRATRLINFGVWLSRQEKNSVISVRESEDCGNNTKMTKLVFEAVAGGQAPSNELIRELEQLSLGAGQSTQQPSPSPSDAGSWGGSSTSTPGATASPPPPPVPAPAVEQAPRIPEKRTGILKPQGSLEKSRAKEMVETEDGSITVGQGRKGGRQNVAMQTILRKGISGAPEADTKQVSFKTPSPITPESTESRHPQWSDGWSKPLQPQPIIPQQLPVFCHPPPPLQQARIAQASPTFSVAPMDNLHRLPGSGFGSSSGLSLHMQPPCLARDDVCHIQSSMSESSDRNSPWWPVPPEQLPPYNARPPLPRFPATTFSNPVTWSHLPPSPHLQASPQHQLSFSLQSQQSPPNLQTVRFPHQQSLYQPEQFSNAGQMMYDSFGFQGISPSMPTHHFKQEKKTSPSNENQCEKSGGVEGFSPYSLFSTNSWFSPAISPAAHSHVTTDREAVKTELNQGSNNGSAIMGAQSLWSGPGPSPLERLLEQQKQLREGPSPKSGT